MEQCDLLFFLILYGYLRLIVIPFRQLYYSVILVEINKNIKQLVKYMECSFRSGLQLRSRGKR